ncbi:hypothetical protein [Nostoc phage Nsp-JY10]
MAFWRIAIDDLGGELPADRLSGVLPYAQTGQKFWEKVVSTDVNMPFTPAEISQFRKKTGLIEADGLVYLTWSVACAHNGISAGSPLFDGQNMSAGANYPIGLAGYVLYRRALSDGGLSGVFSVVPGTTGDGQVTNIAHHYQEIGKARKPFAVEAGYHYEFSLALSGHTDAGTRNGQDGSARVNGVGAGDGSCYLTIEYQPGAFVAT